MLKTRLLSVTAKMPCFMTKGAACADMFLPADVTIPPMDTSKSLKDNIIKVPLNVAFDIPSGFKIVMYQGQVCLLKEALSNLCLSLMKTTTAMYMLRWSILQMNLLSLKRESVWYR